MNEFESLGFFDFEDFVTEMTDEQLIAVNGGSCGAGSSSISNINYRPTFGNCGGGGAVTPSNPVPVPSTSCGGGYNFQNVYTIEEKSIQERIKFALAKIGIKFYNASSGGDQYACDQYVADVLEQAGFNVEEYCVDDPHGKSVNQHVEDMKNKKISFETNINNLDYGGTYVVFMTEHKDGKNSHTGIFTNGGDLGYSFTDNSRGNSNTGVKTFSYSNSKQMSTQYSDYKQMYFIKLD